MRCPTVNHIIQIVAQLETNVAHDIVYSYKFKKTNHTKNFNRKVTLDRTAPPTTWHERRWWNKTTVVDIETPGIRRMETEWIWIDFTNIYMICMTLYINHKLQMISDYIVNRVHLLSIILHVTCQKCIVRIV